MEPLKQVLNVSNDSASGLWVGVNNSINALHFFERCFAATRLPPVYHVGSVKNLLGTAGSENLVFAYSNRYSIFDWGEMPDQIPSKGYCLASMAWMFFDAFGTAEQWQGWSVGGVDATVLSELQQDGLAHHMVGLVDRNGQDVGLDTQTTLLKVSRVNVIAWTHRWCMIIRLMQNVRWMHWSHWRLSSGLVFPTGLL